VLHLGCGLDTRFHRMAPPPAVRWYDVDYPEVIELRRRLFPERPGYAAIGSSVTELAWLDRVPGGEFVFDAMNRRGIGMQRLNRPVQKAGATLRWSIEGPGDLLSIPPRLRCLTATSAFDIEGCDRLSAPHRIAAWIVKAFRG
jgi:hypothetical protein